MRNKYKLDEGRGMRDEKTFKTLISLRLLLISHPSTATWAATHTIQVWRAAGTRGNRMR
jgi:hypothetical protein